MALIARSSNASKRLNHSNEHTHTVCLPDTRISNFTIENMHSFYRNLLCILRNFRENRKILTQNREVGQGFLRQCLRGILQSPFCNRLPQVLLLKNSLPSTYGSITWKLFVFFYRSPASQYQRHNSPANRAIARMCVFIFQPKKFISLFLVKVY